MAFCGNIVDFIEYRNLKNRQRSPYRRLMHRKVIYENKNYKIIEFCLQGIKKKYEIIEILLQTPKSIAIMENQEDAIDFVSHKKFVNSCYFYER